jgi:GDPmannose 4,6-dehydratase
MKKALITGITGQDGSYLAELLLEKGYEVHGLVRRTSNWDVLPNIQHIRDKIKLHYGDMGDSANLSNIVMDVEPDEIYNLAAQSHVHVSFEVPEFTADSNSLGVLRLLEAVRRLHGKKPVRLYQASTSEMFGKVQETPQNELTSFYPRSPYGVAKLFAHWIVVNYRESYNMYACSGILFNHESPRRGETFVTRKITLGVARVVAGIQSSVKLGNIDTLRDWGHAKDYVEGMWLMLQQDAPKDYVLSSGTQYSVRQFCELVAAWHGINLTWQGEGVNEIGIDSITGKVIYEINPEFYRPSEVNTLLGDSRLAVRELGWTRKHSFEDLVNLMCESDQQMVKQYVRQQA